MRDTLKLVGMILVFMALVIGGCTIQYQINSARFPDSPWWSRMFK